MGSGLSWLLCCVTQGKLLNFAEPQRPHLHNECILSVLTLWGYCLKKMGWFKWSPWCSALCTVAVQQTSLGGGCYQPALFAWALRAWCHMVSPQKCLLTIGASAELGLLPSSLRKHCEDDNIYSPTTFTENLENIGGTLEEEKVGAHVGTAWLFSLPGCTAAHCHHTGCCIF